MELLFILQKMNISFKFMLGFWVFSILCCCPTVIIFATETPEQSLRFEMEEIVVTAARVKTRIKSTPKNITVITSDDIEQSTADNIVDLLGREANLNLRSFTGNEGKSGVDIRGMGDTYVSNVIVMVNGFRLNAPDLSGADFLSIPLGQVERIEIIRGGGAVLYGNGAVGGIINIITKKPEEKLTAKVSAGSGSFESYGTRAYIGGKTEQITWQLNSGYKDSKGYRDNGGLRKKDAALTLGYEMFDTSLVEMDLSLLESRIGLPGNISLEDIDDRDKRRMTSRPNDFSSTEDYRITGKIDLDTDIGIFSFKGGYRDRNNSYIIGYNPLLSEKDQTDEILEDTIDLSFSYENSCSIKGLKIKQISGIDFYDTGYLRKDKNNARKNGDSYTIEAFIHSSTKLKPNLSLTTGYRFSRFSGIFRDDSYDDFFSPVFPWPYLYSSWVPGVERKKHWDNHAYEVGMSWERFDPITVFASHSKSYRIPNVDEFAQSDSDLHPQTSLHYDAGFKSAIGDRVEFSLTGFLITTTDEIYYGEDPSTNTSVNRNYDQKTERKGIETEIKIYPFDWIYIWGNYSYTQAKFERSNAFIPLVPEHMGNFGVEWYPHDNLTIAFSGTMAGQRFDGNDQENIEDEQVLGSYQVYDAKITWKKDNFRVYAGVNNIFDTLYVTSSYSGSGYPMPTRSFNFGIEWTY